MIANVLALVIDFRTTEEAERLTRQIAAVPCKGFHVTVAHVDNGNAMSATLTIEQQRHGVRLIRLEHNGGYAAGIRQAIERAQERGERYDAYWLLNSDLEIEPDCLQKLVTVLQTHPGVAAVGPTVRKGRTPRVWGARGVVSPFWGSTAMTAWPESGPLPKWSYIPGCSLLIRHEAYQEVGGIPDRYGMFYEETHLCVQLQKRGWELWVEPSATAYHGVYSLKGGVPAPHQLFYMTRNNLYFWKVNFGIPSFVQFPRTLFMVGRHLIVPLRRARSASEFFGGLKYIAMGLVDGFVFLKNRYTHFERKHFSLEPERPVCPEG